MSEHVQKELKKRGRGCVFRPKSERRKLTEGTNSIPLLSQYGDDSSPENEWLFNGGEEVIGCGKAGQVYVSSGPVRYCPSNQVALRVCLFDLRESTVEQIFQEELKALGNVGKHDHLQYLGYGIYHENPVMVMEYMKGGNLENIMFGNESKTLTEVEALAILIQITSGLEYLHHKGMCHLNLHLGSILVGDYGFSKTLRTIEAQMSSSSLGQ
jgi:serine/threonine protein kinase